MIKVNGHYGNQGEYGVHAPCLTRPGPNVTHFLCYWDESVAFVNWEAGITVAYIDKPEWEA